MENIIRRDGHSGGDYAAFKFLVPLTSIVLSRLSRLSCALKGPDPTQWLFIG